MPKYTADTEAEPSTRPGLSKKELGRMRSKQAVSAAKAKKQKTEEVAEL